MRIIYYDFLSVSLPQLPGTQIASFLRRITLPSVASLTLSRHYIINGTTFERQMLLSVQCVVWFSLQIFSETHLILRRTERCTLRLHVQYPLFLTGFNEFRIFSSDFLKNPQISNFMKISPLGDGFDADRRQAGGRTGGQSDVTQLIIFFAIVWTRLKVNTITIPTKAQYFYRFILRYPPTFFGHFVWPSSGRC